MCRNDQAFCSVPANLGEIVRVWTESGFDGHSSVLVSVAHLGENLVQLAALSRSHPDADGFFVVWRRVIAMTLESPRSSPPSWTPPPPRRGAETMK